MLVSAIGQARLVLYRQVQAGCSAEYPVGHSATSGNKAYNGLGLRSNPFGSLGYLWGTRDSTILWVCQVVTPSCRSDQTRPVLALATPV